MDKTRFKEIHDRNLHNPYVLLYEVYIEEKGNNLDLQSFQQFLQMWVMTRTFGDVNGGLNRIINYLKEKYK